MKRCYKFHLAHVLCLAALTLLCPLSQSRADEVTLTDLGSTAIVNLDSSAGMYQWSVDGWNHLKQQWFWYRVGTGGGQAPINAISTADYTQSAANKVNATYANTDFSINIDYTLIGGGIGQADIMEGIIIHNKTAGDLDFHFYQYSDFNLLNDPAGDTVAMDSTMALQQKGPTQIAEGIISPEASHFEANITGLTGSTLAKLGVSSPLTLSDNPTAGPADVTWAFQWDFVIPANSDWVITKDKLLDVYVVPEPSALTLLGLGITALVFRRRPQV